MGKAKPFHEIEVWGNVCSQFKEKKKTLIWHILVTITWIWSSTKDYVIEFGQEMTYSATLDLNQEVGL